MQCLKANTFATAMSALGQKQNVQRTSSCPLYPRKRHQMRHMECSLGPSTDIPPLLNKRGSARQGDRDFGELARLRIDLD